MRLTERPYTYKVNIGEEPISNTMWGLNSSYQTESRLLTKMVDFLPLIETKAPSKVTVDAEIANLVPGHARAIGKSGTAYIDDFEGSKSSFDIKNVGTWFLASIPKGQYSLYPEAKDDSLLSSGFNRAKLSWYVIDQYSIAKDITQVILLMTKQCSQIIMREVLKRGVSESKIKIMLFLQYPNLVYYPDERTL